MRVFLLRPILLLLILVTVAGCGPKWQLSPVIPPPAEVSADSGMVVAAHPLAAEAGIAVLRDGGNAVDAALAALFMLNVVEPHASGLGGGGFALVRMNDGEAKVIVYRERAPRNIDVSIYYDPADSLRKLRGGATSVCVPGAPAGWAELHNRWGTLPLERLARDAIAAAEEGFPIDQTLMRQIRDYYPMLSADSLLAATFLKDNMPYEAGDTLRQPNLASTLRKLSERGLWTFYRGIHAEAVVEAVQQKGGALTLEDLESYRCDVVEPLTGSYKGNYILTVPPPSGGGVGLLEALKLFEYTRATDKVSSWTPESVHLTAQCISQAYADMEALVADPEYFRFDAGRFFDAGRMKKAAEGISVKTKPAGRKPVSLPDINESGNTTHLVVVDCFGNAVSITQSINYFFGAGVMAGETGLLLNNQMADFSASPDTMNLLAPRKRPRSNMTPVIVLRDDKPILIAGTPGGARIVSTMAQLIAGTMDFGLSISAAIDAPRYFPVRENLMIENRQSLSTMKALKRMGYNLHPAPPFHQYFGGAHAIMIEPETQRITGSADRRRGGAARGY